MRFNHNPSQERSAPHCRELAAADSAGCQLSVGWPHVFRCALFCFVSLLLSPGILSAQEEAVSPESNPTPAPKSLLSKVGFIRLWYVGSPKSPRITAACKTGDLTPKVIGSYVRAGRLGSYRMFLPGEYAIAILDGKAIPDQTGKLPDNPTPLGNPLPISLKGGAFYTALVRDDGGKITAVLIEDLPPKDAAGPTLRVFDFGDSAKKAIRLHFADQVEEIWNSSMPALFTKDLAGMRGPVWFELVSADGTPPRVLGTYEAELGPGKSYSLVISPDRYGKTSFSFAEDASSQFGAEEIQSFLQGK